jgi:hypothetical protein
MNETLDVWEDTDELKTEGKRRDKMDLKQCPPSLVQ